MDSIRYNWDGDVICQECAVERKRFIAGMKKPVPTDIRAFVSPADDVVIKRVLGELARTKGLPITKGPGDFDRRAMVLWDHVARTIRYQGDRKRKKAGPEDLWLLPAEVQALGKGDCEDASFLLASLLVGSGISPFNVRVVLGRLVDGAGRGLGDHAWPMYKNELGDWCILEATRERAAWCLTRADELIAEGEVNYEPHFCFNSAHLWAIRHERTRYKDIFSYLKGHSERLVNLEDPRFPSGGWLSAITGDNTPGHWELTTQLMEGRGFSEDALAVAADASQDPDFYEWYHPAAHAQTDCDVKTGATTETAEAGIAHFLAWVDRRRRAFLEERDPRRALFFLGYLLHGVEDLASHQGVTNAQHAYDSYIALGHDHDCDHDAGNRAAALRFGAALLDRLLPLHPELAALKAYEAGFSLLPPKLPKAEKAKALGLPGWDFTLPAVAEYKALAAAYEKVKDANPRITWDREAVFRRLMS